VKHPLLLTDSDAPEVLAAGATLGGWEVRVIEPFKLIEALEEAGDTAVVVVTAEQPGVIRGVTEAAHRRGTVVVAGCTDDAARRRATEMRVDEWFFMPPTTSEVVARVHSALARARVARSAKPHESADRQAVEHLRYDFLTGLPTLPVMIERSRTQFAERGELIVLYFNFVRYSKIEEIYGWEKLDAVLETTALAVREFLHDTALNTSRVMVSFVNDDDFVFFHVPADGDAPATDAEITELVSRLQVYVGSRIETVHGEEIAALFDIYVGRAHVYYNPKIRLERLIYRGIREAANASKSVEERERGKRVGDLRTALHERGVYVDYHPIVYADTRAIYGYEALARGVMRSLRSPEVMFEVAAEADLIWELSRLCRSRALEGMNTRLNGDELLFLNVDPHDFADPGFDPAAVEQAHRVVIEITERTAIKDYPKFREHLKRFREMGFRFAVDDAGSGYAGLGSIANLEPDYIKLDMSLINCIDTNFIKQNLVETMVRFANDQGAMVIAEGVERSEEFEVVKGLGVHLVQGFYLHKPASADTPLGEVPTAG
jgi:EAL domain-containing protein (putative c-di-GMP-specific phosphodiesterase class I)/GGDEF domain-containing protein